MSEINRLNMEYKILKRSIKLTMKNLRDESFKRGSEPSIVKQLQILDCSIDQHNKLFKLARNDNELEVMKRLITYNFKRERSMIQNLAIRIYRVTRPMAIQIIYDMWRRSINEELQYLHNDYEELVKNFSVEELQNNRNFQRLLELFEIHDENQSLHDSLFMECKAQNNIDGMNQSISYDIPEELKVVQKIRDAISRLQPY
ncbi:hypothetical protein HA402_011058 [Bradysia odoriphaga]|nr:hypothetical protein HA402_011058 [Bradysia odoriphaga]